jgi:polysaccharide export outer membrane protein
MSFIRIVYSVLVALTVMASPASYGQERRIQPGDRLTITVLDREDLTRTVIVRRDGTIQYPFMGSEDVNGYTLTRLRTIITLQLTRSLGSPPQAVNVLWSEDTFIDQIQVSVLGQVASPGVIRVEEESGIQGAITAAGGLLPIARQDGIKLRRLTNQGLAVLDVDLARFLETGDLSYLPAIEDGDIIIVPGGEVSSLVSIEGGVNTPGQYPVLPGAKVYDMIIQAGGFSDDARKHDVRLLKPSGRNDVKKEYLVDISKLLRTGQEPLSPPVESGDLIVVRKRFFTASRLVAISGVGSVLSIITLFVFRR